MSFIKVAFILTVFSITKSHCQTFFQDLEEQKSYHEKLLYIQKIINDITIDEFLEVVEEFGEYIDPYDYEILQLFIEFKRNEKLHAKPDWLETFEEIYRYRRFEENNKNSNEQEKDFVFNDEIKTKKNNEDENENDLIKGEVGHKGTDETNNKVIQKKIDEKEKDVLKKGYVEIVDIEEILEEKNDNNNKELNNEMNERLKIRENMDKTLKKLFSWSLDEDKSRKSKISNSLEFDWDFWSTAIIKYLLVKGQTNKNNSGLPEENNEEPKILNKPKVEDEESVNLNEFQDEIKKEKSTKIENAKVNYLYTLDIKKFRSTPEEAKEIFRSFSYDTKTDYICSETKKNSECTIERVSSMFYVDSILYLSYIFFINFKFYGSMVLY